MHVYVYLCVCISMHMYMYICIFICLCMQICIYMHTYKLCNNICIIFYVHIYTFIKLVILNIFGNPRICMLMSRATYVDASMTAILGGLDWMTDSLARIIWAIRCGWISKLLSIKKTIWFGDPVVKIQVFFWTVHFCPLDAKMLYRLGISKSHDFFTGSSLEILISNSTKISG